MPFFTWTNAANGLTTQEEPLLPSINEVTPFITITRGLYNSAATTWRAMSQETREWNSCSLSRHSRTQTTLKTAWGAPNLADEVRNASAARTWICQWSTSHAKFQYCAAFRSWESSRWIRAKCPEMDFRHVQQMHLHVYTGSGNQSAEYLISEGWGAGR
jgi:hypothetical protein